MITTTTTTTTTTTNMSSVNDSDNGLKTYVDLQSTWTRKQDELLRLFADDVAVELSLSLKEQLNTTWDVLSGKDV